MLTILRYQNQVLQLRSLEEEYAHQLLGKVSTVHIGPSNNFFELHEDVIKLVLIIPAVDNL